ncbi:MAG: hypothetical protein Q9222_002373 [Ikaeria aurantiellina]
MLTTPGSEASGVWVPLTREAVVDTVRTAGLEGEVRVDAFLGSVAVMMETLIVDTRDPGSVCLKGSRGGRQLLRTRGKPLDADDGPTAALSGRKQGTVWPPIVLAYSSVGSYVGES